MDMGADLGGDMAMPAGDPADTGEPPEEVAQDIPLAATDNLSENEGENLSRLPHTGEEVEVDINLDALQEAVEHLQGEQEIDLTEADLAALLQDDVQQAGEMAPEDPEEEEGGTEGEAAAAEAAATGKQDKESGYGGTDESLEISEELIDDIVERLTVDMGASLKGWAGRSSEDVKYELERALAHRRSTDMQDDLETLRKAQEELVFENKQLKETLQQYKQATEEIRENVHHVNLSNARLLYTNRVLRNTSLNERQKTKIADAISKAGSVTEAKTIYQTLESAVESTRKSGPQSLSEAIGRRTTSVIRASRKESISSDPIAERMKRLAGIK
jgi:2-phospho-L-lactate guanylyltransferase (CobY/MobA/RfbA family)